MIDAWCLQWRDRQNCPKPSIFTAEGQRRQPGCKVCAKHNAQSCQPHHGHAAAPPASAWAEAGPFGQAGGREQAKHSLYAIDNPEVCCQDKRKFNPIPFTWKMNFHSCPGWQRSCCRCYPFHHNTVSATTSHSESLYFTATAAFSHQTF